MLLLPLLPLLPLFHPPLFCFKQVALSSGLMLGAVAFLFGLLTISYLNSVLLSIVDAVYIVSVLTFGVGVLCLWVH